MPAAQPAERDDRQQTRLVKLLHVVGARPNFMKIAPVMAAVEAWNRGDGAAVRFEQVLVHTGQHYDAAMSDVFFSELKLPAPAYNLDVGSGSHAHQTAEVLQRLEPVLLREQPDLVVVVGDVNSTLAAALCAVKLNLPVAHIEAGLRSGDRAMPEEINRLLTDQLAELLFATCADAPINLAHEGVDAGRVQFVGNPMIDTLERVRGQIDATPLLDRLGLQARGFALVTLHRPSNVDDSEQLRRMVDALVQTAARLPLLFPVHGRTRARLAADGLLAALADEPRVVLSEPLGYRDFISLAAAARLVLTDSGGIQEETTILGTPCLTLRTSTERPVTVSMGTNRLVDPYDVAAIMAAVDDCLAAPLPAAGRRPDLWDGHAAERIVAAIAAWAQGREQL